MTRAGLALVRVALLAALGVTLGGCASGFDRKWKAAASATPGDRFAGQWAGEWRSTRGTHHGALECVFSKQGAGVYEADFHAHWGHMASSYSVPFKTHAVGGQLGFEGEKDLGPLFGGVYRYRGQVSPTRFSATYASRFDAGVFEMTRVAGAHRAVSGQEKRAQPQRRD